MGVVWYLSWGGVGLDMIGCYSSVMFIESAAQWMEGDVELTFLQLDKQTWKSASVSIDSTLCTALGLKTSRLLQNQ